MESKEENGRVFSVNSGGESVSIHYKRYKKDTSINLPHLILAGSLLGTLSNHVKWLSYYRAWRIIYILVICIPDQL